MLGQLGCPVTNTLANWADSFVMKKIKCCQYGPREIVIKKEIGSRK